MNETVLRIKGQDYKLVYNINTLCTMTQGGIDILNMQDAKIDLIFLRSLFYYGLKEENKRITENQAGLLMGEYLQEGNSFSDFMQLVLAAIAKALGNNIEEDQVVEVIEESTEGK